MEQILLEQLKNKIKGMPCNSLGRIYPDDFVRWFNVATDKAAEFLGELIIEKLVVCKYNFDCICNNRCTAYEYMINDRVFECEECGRNYNKEYIRKFGELLYELNKNEILDYQREEIDYKRIAKEVSNNIISFAMEKKEDVQLSEKVVNNINIYGNVSDSQIMQGAENSQQRSGGSEIDYGVLLSSLQQIQKYTMENMFDNEFGTEAENVRQLVDEAIDAAENGDKTSKIKVLLEKIKGIAGSVAPGVISMGIKALVEELFNRI